MSDSDLDDDLFDADYIPAEEDQDEIPAKRLKTTAAVDKQTKKIKSKKKPAAKKAPTVSNMSSSSSTTVIGMYQKNPHSLSNLPELVIPDIEEQEEQDPLDIYGEDSLSEDSSKEQRGNFDEDILFSALAPDISSPVTSVEKEAVIKKTVLAEPERGAYLVSKIKKEETPEAKIYCPLVTSVDSVPIPAVVTASSALSMSVESQESSVELPTITSDGAPVLFMYWLDAREDTFGKSGTVYLFGKSFDPTKKKFQSCCVRINGISRSVFVLPRPFKVDEKGHELKGDVVEIADVITELGSEMARLGIKQRKFKPVYRWYAFEKEGIPRERSLWLKVKYSSEYPALNFADSNKVYRTFSDVFGDKRSFLELFLLKRRLKGPGWIAVSNARVVDENAKISWCRTEYIVESPKCVSTTMPSGLVLSLPTNVPLTVMSINLATFLNEQQKINEIAAVSLFIQDGVNIDATVDAKSIKWTEKWSCIRRTGDKVFPLDLERTFSSKRVMLPKLEQSEKSLLTSLLEEIRTWDPDMFVGHNFIGFDLDVLLHRLAYHRDPNWSCLGRLKLRQMPRLQSGAGGISDSTWEERAILNGRLVGDTYLLSKEYLKETSYKLLNLAVSQELTGLSGDTITSAMVDEDPLINPVEETKSSEGIFRVLQLCDTKALLSLKLLHKLNAIPLTRRLTCLAGNLWSKTLIGSRAERIEFLLLHKFYIQKFILPDKASAIVRRATLFSSRQEANSSRRDEADMDVDDPLVGSSVVTGPFTSMPEFQRVRGKPKYTGGKVLEPKRGLYTDFVLLLDFNSLYPSLIQEYNVCFTTVERPEMLADGSYPDAAVPGNDALVCAACKAGILQNGGNTMKTEPSIVKKEYQRGESCPHRCILPKAIRELVDSRRQVKKLLKEEKDPAKREQLDIRQKALKLTANSIYGCLGFQSSRFYAQPIAQLITSKGREALSNTVELISKIDPTLNVIYGDTDSVMISTGLAADVNSVLRLANGLKKEINKYYKHLEIDVDGVFKSILLVRKKKYAALKLIDLTKGVVPSNIRREVKGLDLVRRDWCPLSQNVSAMVLDEILSGHGSEEIVERIRACLESVSNSIRTRQIPLKDYVISKSLTKLPEHYADKQNQPHVMVALRMQKERRSVQVHDIIPYIICDAECLPADLDGDKNRIATRAFHYDDVRISHKLMPDIDWYLATQIHPPVARLCEHIQGMDSYYIAELMGLKECTYITHHSSSGDGNTGGIGGWSSAYNYSTHGSIDEEEQCQTNPKFNPLEFYCGKCQNPKVNISIRHRLFASVLSLLTDGSLDERSAGPVKFLSCDCGEPIPYAKVYNTLMIRIREHQQRYYAQFRKITGAELPVPQASETYLESDLQFQLSYYLTLFDVKHAKDAVHAKLTKKFLLPLKKEKNVPALSMESQQRRMEAVLDRTYRRSLGDDDAYDAPSGSESIKNNREKISALYQLIQKSLKSCRRYFVDTDHWLCAFRGTNTVHKT